MATPARNAQAASDAARLRAPITDRVNVEPAILHGMTLTEAQMIGAASLAIFLILGAILFAATGYWQILLMLGIAGPMATLWFGSKYLAKIKRGRPDAYYTQAIHLWLAERGLAKPKFLTHQGFWSLGRTLDVPLSSDFDPPAEAFGSPPRKPS